MFQSSQHNGKIAPTSSRISFTRGIKLQPIHYYYDIVKNVNQASNKFKVDRKQIRNWVKSEELIQKQKRTSRSTWHEKAMFSIIEKHLYT